MPRAPRHLARPSLAAVLGRAVVTALTFTTATGLVAVADARMTDAQRSSLPGTTVVTTEQLSAPEARLMREYNCSTVGYGNGATPQGAIVRGPRHRAKVVTFDEGWDVYTGRGRSELVAVCLQPPG